MKCRTLFRMVVVFILWTIDMGGQLKAEGARLRGAMVSPSVTREDLVVLAKEWGANHIRYQLLWDNFPKGPADEADMKGYDAWFYPAVSRLEATLAVCEELGLEVVVDLHTPPGGRPWYDCRLFSEKKWQERFIGCWCHLAERCKGRKSVLGFDLLNEPSEGKRSEDCLSWNDLAYVTALEIRKIDPTRKLIVESAEWGGAKGFERLKALPLENVVYSFHCYTPLAFTHQGVAGQSLKPALYPGPVEGEMWNKERLRKEMQPVVDFQKRHQAVIYVGEFSAVRWAPNGSGARYLSDIIELFEEQGYGWAYHAFRESDYWSLEHSEVREDQERMKTPGKRLEVVKGWLEKNRGKQVAK